MIDKRAARLRRAAQTRRRIREQATARLAVHRSNGHIYAQVYSADGTKVLTFASTTEKEVRSKIPSGGTKAAAAAVGKRIAEKARGLGIQAVAFDRSGYKYHGRVKALADAAREAGLKI
jgi:large subunit ribosomal protein L18